MAVTYRASRRFDETNAVLDRAREIESDNVQLLTPKVHAAFAQGDVEAARHYLEPVKVDPTLPIATNAWLKHYHVTRQSAAAAEMLRQLLAGDVPPRLAPQYRARLSTADDEMKPGLSTRPAPKLRLRRNAYL